MELEYDERYHPLRASEAAARHLEENYEALRSWPLAITAYNHGRAGMKRAVRRVGTRDLGEIVDRYRSRTFGFASRNFYAEFVAAAVVYENREHYFPGVSPLPPLEFEEFVPELYVPLAALAKGAGVDAELLREINPALSREVWAGHLYLPRGYPLMVPAGTHDAFGAAFEALPAARKSPHQVGFRYRVRSGDTLSKIAAKFGTSVPALQRANRLSSPHRIRVGQRLLVPPAGGAVAMAPGVPGSHVVQPGETLSRIAGRYGTTVTAVLAANSLRSADLIHPGQRLTIPARAGRTTHVVRSGETLAAIARRYGTTVRAIQHANRIRNHLIRPAQVLVIP
jgi:membrane-bound lytic murein transglycosylase D